MCINLGICIYENAPMTKQKYISLSATLTVQRKACLKAEKIAFIASLVFNILLHEVKKTFLRKWTWSGQILCKENIHTSYEVLED